MSERIPQSTTFRVPLQAYLSLDHITPAVGKTIAITISKDGNAYGNPSAGATNAQQIGNGSYYVDLSTDDTDNIGPLFILGTNADIDNVNALYQVVNPNNAGFVGVPDAVAGASNGLLISGSNTGPMSITGGVTFSNAGGDGLILQGTGSGAGLKLLADGGGHGLYAAGGEGGSFLGTSGPGFFTASSYNSSDSYGFWAVGGQNASGAKFEAGYGGGSGIDVLGVNGGAGINALGGTLGDGIRARSGGTGGYGLCIAGAQGGMRAWATGMNAWGMVITGTGTNEGVKITGGVTGNAVSLISGATSGDGLNIYSQSGAGISSTGVTNSIVLSGSIVLDGNLGIGGATTISGVVTATNASNDISGVSLSTAGIAAVVTAIFAHVVEGSRTFVGWIRLVAAQAYCVTTRTGDGPYTRVYRNEADDDDRITATTNDSGERSDITLNDS